jgi:Terminase large subunit, T4likevirus-type, N-terminal
MVTKTVVLPKLHDGQINLYNKGTRTNVVRAGRRFGKSIFAVWLSCDHAVKGKQVGIFAPEHKQLAELWDNIRDILDPIVKSANRNDGAIKTITGGKVDFWTLNDNELAGRGRSYDMVIVDEAAFTKSPQMREQIWYKSIKPTMLTTRGVAWVFSTPNGVNPDNFFYSACHDPMMGFAQFHAPSLANPYVPPEEIELERERQHPQVFQQEYLAEFIDWRSVNLLSIDCLLVGGQPVEYPTTCDTVYAVIDSAMKFGKQYDGTAVVYFSLNRHGTHLLTILDWSIISIDAAMLEHYVPSIFERLEELAGQTKARYGVTGLFVEPKGSGIVILQHGSYKGWRTIEIEEKFVQVGKDDRAMSISGYHSTSRVKISALAYDKVMPFKGATRNHLISEIANFRLGDPDAIKRSDDLCDAYVYGVALGCGGTLGF